MQRKQLPRPRTAALSPAADAPPELAALGANVRARLAFWSALHARGATFEGPAGSQLQGVPFGALVDAATDPATFDGSAAVSFNLATMARAGEAAARVSELAASDAPDTAARVIWRTVQSIAPRKLWRAALQRPSLAWRYPLAPVWHETADEFARVASYLDNAATVRGAVEVPPFAGTAERVTMRPPYDGGDVNEWMRGPAVQGTRCVPVACIVPPVALPEVLGALRASPDREARDAADVIERHAAAGTNPAAELRAAGLAPWGPYCAAAVLCTLREIRDVQGRHRAFAFPTTQASNAAVNHIAAGAKASRIDTRERPGGPKLAPRRAILRVEWEGRMLPVQLCLDFRAAATDEAIAAVLDNMADDGLRDWLALHALADEQGNTGDVRWTWNDHKRVALYSARADAAARTAEGRETDDALRRAVIRRLWQFTRAALWEDYGDGRKMRRIGDGPFARIVIIGDPAGLREEPADFTHVGITINRELYRGAHRDAKGEHRHFTGIPGAVFRLRGGALRLAVFLLRAERMHRDAGMSVEITEGKLMQYARVQGGAPTARQLPAARAELARYIAAVTEAMNDGETPGSLAAMTPDLDRPGVYRWTPARWRIERERLGAAPDRPALPPSDRPYTGGALRAWRDARDLSQRDAARLLGVGFRTVQRAEQRPDDPLPRAFHRAGLPWGVTAADAARQLGAGAPGPVEGEDAPDDAADDTAA